MTQDAVFATAACRAIPLTDQDRPAVQALLVRCTDYYQLVEGHAPGESAAADLYADLAPGKSAADKMLLGLWTPSGVLLGVLDAMRDYPTPGEWFIGLMLIDPVWRGQGVGEQVCQGFADWAKKCGVKVLGLGVVEANVKALHFWRKLGFESVRRTPPRPFGNKTHIVIMLRRSLSDSP